MNANEILKKLETDEGRREFLADPGIAEPHMRTRARIASELHLALTAKRSADRLSERLTQVGTALQERLKSHEAALRQAAQASERHAGKLTAATWALVGATTGLVVIAVVQLIAALRGA